MPSSVREPDMFFYSSTNTHENQLLLFATIDCELWYIGANFNYKSNACLEICNQLSL